jgi:hypothetical protein
MSNSAVVILSHANNDLKLNILKECISEVKKRGYKIILSSSYPIHSDIQLSVDYCVLDNENPLIMDDDLNQIGGAIFFWLKYPQFENNYCVDVNHAYAVMKLMKNASGVAKINKIENLHYVNYDYLILDDNLLVKNENILNENDLHYYYYLENDKFMNTGIFSIKTDVMFSSFNDINNKKEFCQRGKSILEELMLDTFRNKDLKISRELYTDIRDKNNFDLIDSADFLVSKKENGIKKELYLYLSKDSNYNYYIIAKSDINCFIDIDDGQFKYDSIEINKFPRIFQIDYNILEKGLNLNVPEYNYFDRFDLEKKLCHCNIVDNSIVEYFKDLNKYELHQFQNSNIVENNDDFYSISLKNSTDKVYYHGYHYFYPKYFDEFKYDEFKMLEIGYGDGASMKSWVEYFPKADITVMDINVELEYSDRCRVFKGDQSNENDLNMIIDKVKSAKLIIDDGSHNPLHQLNTFYYLFRYLLEPGGVYIIEDIELSYWNPDSALYGFKSGDINIIHSLLKCNEMVNHEFSGVKNTLDISTITYAQNCIIITKRDLEESNYFNRGYRFQDCIDGLCNWV